MSVREVGSYIGYNRVTSTSQDSASGIWSLAAVERRMRAAAWPVPFQPSNLSGLQLWLDASDASTLYDATTGGSLVAADGTVKRWEDKSGNARHATEASNGPQRKAAVQGGLDVLRFDGIDDVLSIPSSTATFKFIHSDEASIFIAGKYGTTADPNSASCFMGNRGSNSVNVGFQIDIDDRSAFGFNDRLRFLTPSASNEIQDFVTPNTFAVMSHVLDVTNATASQRIASRVNSGSAQAQNTNTASANTSNATHDLQIGNDGNSTSKWLNGDIAEIIIYNSALSDTDREAVENYLMAKWGIT